MDEWELLVRKWVISKVTESKMMFSKIKCSALTFRGEPLMSTLSANLTRLGWDFSFAFFAADRRADFRLELWHCKQMMKIFKIILILNYFLNLSIRDSPWLMILPSISLIITLTLHKKQSLTQSWYFINWWTHEHTDSLRGQTEWQRMTVRLSLLSCLGEDCRNRITPSFLCIL